MGFMEVLCAIQLPCCENAVQIVRAQLVRAIHNQLSFSLSLFLLFLYPIYALHSRTADYAKL